MTLVTTMQELEDRYVYSTIATQKHSGCYQCQNFGKIENKGNKGNIYCFINFKDKSRILLCGIHFLYFKQKRS